MDSKTNNRIVNCISKFASIVCAPFNSATTAILAIVMLVVIAAPEATYNQEPLDRIVSMTIAMTQHITEMYAICLAAHLLSLIHKSLRKVVLGIAFAIILVLSFLDSYLILIFKSPISVWALTSVANTNFNEATSFLTPLLLSRHTWLIVSAYLFTVLLTIKIASLCATRLKNHSTLVKVASAIVITTSIVTFVKLENHMFANAYHTDRSIKLAPFERTTLYHLAQTRNEYSKASRIVGKCFDANSTITTDSCSFTSPNIILVIGESFNKHHSSLYGYHRNTNPLLSQREGLIVFNDVVAPANLTFICFNQILSTARSSASEEWYDRPLFPAIFKKAGYNVVFYSNQFVNNFRNQYFSNFLGSFYFDDKRMESLMFDHRNPEKARYDMGLLDAWKEHRNTEEVPSHNLIMLHLIGQHCLANTNYPKEYEHFTADSITDHPELSDKERSYVAGYDNATRYNDMVVNEIINTYASTDAIVIYFSDHGDEVYDFRNKLGRALDFDAGGGACAHCQLDVPFLVYPTETYRKRHPEMVAKLEAAVNRPFMTDDLPHMLLELAGIATPYYNPTRSLINEKFNAKRRRLIKIEGRTYDYDAGKYVK